MNAVNDTDSKNRELILRACHPSPYSYLGLQEGEDGYLVATTFQPGATAVDLISKDKNKVIAKLEQFEDSGIFSKALRRKKRFDYVLQVHYGDHSLTVEDPFGFSTVLGELDVHLLAEGKHEKPYEKLGSHLAEMNGVQGVSFVVWAPNASHVAVVGDFNYWDGRRNPMRKRHECGVWETFVPGLKEGDRYKYEIKDHWGSLLPVKADPFALQSELRPGTASLVAAMPDYKWKDKKWMEKRQKKNALDAAISIYEVHLGSWRRDENGDFLNYRDLAHQLVDYVKDMGFSHIQLMPVSEHPFDGSWGYQPIGLFAPTSRFGSTEDFQYFVDHCHKNGVGLLIDWVPGHFPTDAHGLARFDGTALYEHQDPRQGYHPDWNTLIYNFGRTEVVNFLNASALHWIDRFHVDGIRVDAVASMLYLDYSREAGEWIPNQYGGRENLEAVDFLRGFNEALYDRYPGAFSVAEESTSWPGVSRPVDSGGLGFGYKWNMGWMNDTLEYMKRDPVHRQYHHNELSFGLVYAFDENFVLPLSHDEVVHGKGSILARMPGDTWQKFANLRAYYGFMWTHPGKKLMFMGSEFGQGAEWNFESELDWHQLDVHWHSGIQNLIRDLNGLYRNTKALYQLDCDGEGFQWLDHENAQHSVYSFVRFDKKRKKPVIVVCNFTPAVHHDFRIGAPVAGSYREALNTDDGKYSGSNQRNAGEMHTEDTPYNGQDQSLSITVPPLATVVFELA